MATIKEMKIAAARMLARARVKSGKHGQASNARGGLYPLSLAAYAVDEYRMMSGWPVAIPDQDIQARCDVNAQGEVIAFRDDPGAVNMNSQARWFADSDDFVPAALCWYPHAAQEQMPWRSSVGWMPTFFDDYEYRRGSERFIEQAINFDSDTRQHMWADLDQLIGGGQGYTVLMAVNLHSVYGDSGRTFVGLWGPGLPTPNTDIFPEVFPSYVEVTLRGGSLYVASDQAPPTKVMVINDLLASPAPVYLAFCFSRPKTTIYAGNGSGSMRHGTVYIGNNATPLSGKVVLGRSNGTVVNTADMAVLDLNLYTDNLSTDEVIDEVAKLCATYGGDQ